MRARFKIVAISLLGYFVLASFENALAGNPPKKSESGRALDLKDLPLPVIESAQKEIPDIAFISVEKRSNWRRGQTYRIWAMDEKRRQVYLEISASGKVIERPKLVKEKEGQTKEQQGQTK
jgi:hypothetical protein